MNNSEKKMAQAGLQGNEAGKKLKKILLTKPRMEPKLNDDDIKRFDELTKHVKQKNIPILPFKSMADYLLEYNLIMKKESKLNANQRVRVKNVIHAEVKKGTITLMLDKNEK